MFWLGFFCIVVFQNYLQGVVYIYSNLFEVCGEVRVLVVFKKFLGDFDMYLGLKVIGLIFYE